MASSFKEDATLTLGFVSSLGLSYVAAFVHWEKGGWIDAHRELVSLWFLGVAFFWSWAWSIFVEHESKNNQIKTLEDKFTPQLEVVFKDEPMYVVENRNEGIITRVFRFRIVNSSSTTIDHVEAKVQYVKDDGSASRLISMFTVANAIEESQSVFRLTPSAEEIIIFFQTNYYQQNFGLDACVVFKRGDYAQIDLGRNPFLTVRVTAHELPAAIVRKFHINYERKDHVVVTCE